MGLELISHRTSMEHGTELNRDHQQNSPPPKDYKSPDERLKPLLGAGRTDIGFGKSSRALAV